MRAIVTHREIHTRELVLLAVLLAGVVAVIGLALEGPSIDASQVQPIGSARAAPPVPRAATAALAASAIAPRRPAASSPGVVPEDEAPDEASHALRPEAAH